MLTLILLDQAFTLLSLTSSNDAFAVFVCWSVLVTRFSSIGTIFNSFRDICFYLFKNVFTNFNTSLFYSFMAVATMSM